MGCKVGKQVSSIVCYLLIFLTCNSCEPKNTIPDNNLIKSLQSLPLELDKASTEFENEIIHKIEQTSSVAVKEIEKIIYYLAKIREGEDVNNEFYEEVRISAKNIHLYIDLVFREELSDFSRHMALSLVSGFFFANPNLNEIPVEIIRKKWELLISRIVRVLDKHNKYKETFIGSLCAILVDALSFSEGSGDIFIVFSEVNRKYQLNDRLRELYESNRLAVKVFLTYFLLKRGDISALEWTVDNYDSLSMIRVRREFKNKTNIIPTTKQAWVLEPPLLFIFCLNKVVVKLSDLEFPQLLYCLTGKEFKNSNQWQTWYKENKDRIYWDTGVKRYRVR